MLLPPKVALSAVVAVPVLLASAWDGLSSEADVSLLDPAATHYGKTYAGWVEEWVNYTHRHAPPACLDPLADVSGDACTAHQDPDSPVFFLSGAYGGVYERNCQVPAGKALFFPILNTAADNAGTPADEQMTTAEMRQYVESAHEGFETDKMFVRVDGKEVKGLADGGISAAPYVLHLGPTNAYDCVGLEGVTGRFDGFAGGYWALLPPLAEGEHTVEFGAERMTSPVSGDPFELTVRYQLEVR